jgi:hypothetical protein
MKEQGALNGVRIQPMVSIGDVTQNQSSKQNRHCNHFFSFLSSDTATSYQAGYVHARLSSLT